MTVIPPSHVSRPVSAALPTGDPDPNSPSFAPVYPFEASASDPNIPTCLQFLNRRIQDTRLVERSLRNLVERTSTDPLDNLAPRSGPSAPIPVNDTVAKRMAEVQIPIINFEADWYGPKSERAKRIRMDSSG